MVLGIVMVLTVWVQNLRTVDSGNQILAWAVSSLPKVQFGVWHPLCAGTEMAPSGSVMEICVAILYSAAREFACCEELGF